MKIPGFIEGLYFYSITLPDGIVKINTDTNGDIIDLKVSSNTENGFLYSSDGSKNQEDFDITIIYKAANGLFNWDIAEYNLIPRGTGRVGNINSNVSVYDVAKSYQLPVVEVTAKATAKVPAKKLNKWYIAGGVILAVVLLMLLTKKTYGRKK